MTRQLYIPRDNQWVLYPEFDRDTFIQDVYDQVGTTFPIEAKADGGVMFDPDKLPAGVSETDVEQAVKDNHPHR